LEYSWRKIVIEISKNSGSNLHLMQTQLVLVRESSVSATRRGFCMTMTSDSPSEATRKEMIDAEVAAQVGLSWVRLKTLTPDQILQEIGQVSLGIRALNAERFRDAGAGMAAANAELAAGRAEVARDFWKDAICPHRAEINGALTVSNVGAITSLIVAGFSLGSILISVAILIVFWVIQGGVNAFCAGWEPPADLKKVAV
jgi:hypothetical protein